MSVSLLDVNVLVALFDPDHIHHEPSHAWLAEHRTEGWATCPLTENGLVRILASAAYRGEPVPAARVVERLSAFRRSGHHSFWPDEISLCDAARFAAGLPVASRQLTDVYLLGLAVSRNGRLVTFDRSIPVAAVADASERHLSVLGG